MKLRTVLNRLNNNTMSIPELCELTELHPQTIETAFKKARIIVAKDTGAFKYVGQDESYLDRHVKELFRDVIKTKKVSSNKRRIGDYFLSLDVVQALELLPKERRNKMLNSCLRIGLKQKGML